MDKEPCRRRGGERDRHPRCWRMEHIPLMVSTVVLMGKMCSALPAALLELQPTCLLLVLLFKVGSLGVPGCHHPLYFDKP